MAQDALETTENDPLLSRPARASSKDDDADDDDDARTADGTLFSRQSAMISTIAESVDEFVSVCSEIIDDVIETFEGEIEDAKDGQNFFLEMSLVRNLSILPSDTVDTSQLVEMTRNPLPDIDYWEEMQEHEREDEQEGQMETLPTISEEKIYREELLERKRIQSFDAETKSTIQVAEMVPKDEPQTSASTSTPLSAYLLLASAVISLSSIGPLLDLQEGASSTMKVHWRTAATSVVLFPFAASSMIRE